MGPAASCHGVRRARRAEAPVLRARPSARCSSQCARRSVVGRIAAIENRAHNAFHERPRRLLGILRVHERPGGRRRAVRRGDALARRARTGRPARPDEPQHQLRVRAAHRRLRAPAIVHDRRGIRPTTPTLCERAGMQKAKDLVAYFIPMGDQRWSLPPAFERLGDARAAEERSGVSRPRPAALRAGARDLLGRLQLGVGAELGLRADVEGRSSSTPRAT